ncbi:MAG: hypothetical protein RL220_234 [Bacteroidota bacterium]
MLTHRFRYSGLSPYRFAGSLIVIFALVLAFTGHHAGFLLLIPAAVLIASFGGVEFDDVNMRYRVFHHFILFAAGDWKSYTTASTLRLDLGSIYHSAISGRRSSLKGYHAHYFEIWLISDGCDPRLLFTFDDYSSALEFMQDKLSVLNLPMFDDYSLSVEESRQRPRR